MTRIVEIPVVTTPDGEARTITVRATLVDAITLDPIVAYTADGARYDPAIARSGAAIVEWPLVPTGELAPPTKYQVVIEGPASPLAPPVYCVLEAGAEPLPLWRFLRVQDAPEDALDLWATLLLTTSEREAMSAASEPSAANPLATIADVLLPYPNNTSFASIAESATLTLGPDDGPDILAYPDGGGAPATYTVTFDHTAPWRNGHRMRITNVRDDELRPLDVVLVNDAGAVVQTVTLLSGASQAVSCIYVASQGRWFASQ